MHKATWSMFLVISSKCLLWVFEKTIASAQTMQLHKKHSLTSTTNAHYMVHQMSTFWVCAGVRESAPLCAKVRSLCGLFFHIIFLQNSGLGCLSRVETEFHQISGEIHKLHHQIRFQLHLEHGTPADPPDPPDWSFNRSACRPTSPITWAGTVVNAC
jgi:hypothetical protein